MSESHFTAITENLMNMPGNPAPVDGEGVLKDEAVLLAENDTRGPEDIVGSAQRLAESLFEAFDEVITPLERRITNGQEAIDKALHVISQLTGEIRLLKEELLQVRQGTDMARNEGLGLASEVAAIVERLDGLDASAVRTQAEVIKVQEGQSECQLQVRQQSEEIVVVQEGVARSLEGVNVLADRHDLLSQQVSVMVLESSQRAAQVQTLEDAVTSQAAREAALSAALSRFQERQEAIERRVDTQASAIRMLHSNLRDLGGWLEKLRNALGKVDDAVRMSGGRSLSDHV